MAVTNIKPQNTQELDAARAAQYQKILAGLADERSETLKRRAEIDRRRERAEQLQRQQEAAEAREREVRLRREAEQERIRITEEAKR